MKNTFEGGAQEDYSANQVAPTCRCSGAAPRFAPAKAVNLTAPRTIVITLLYSGVEGMNVNMVHVREAGHQISKGE